ncbi:hypothetical protein DFP72DRAFT_851142 [Ephemerocybe angulata]|uniref:Uncharacterized protein n=1 Tax=Ephemerocybe angulata TaxID=980116 RepID=A0A8H6HR43_9AGAR|nr:hypothetical protein DFP72DRAFT_851142 [Tulosesus angulatus]
MSTPQYPDGTDFATEYEAKKGRFRVLNPYIDRYSFEALNIYHSHVDRIYSSPGWNINLAGHWPMRAAFLALYLETVFGIKLTQKTAANKVEKYRRYDDLPKQATRARQTSSRIEHEGRNVKPRVWSLNYDGSPSVLEIRLPIRFTVSSSTSRKWFASTSTSEHDSSPSLLSVAITGGSTSKARVHLTSPWNTKHKGVFTFEGREAIEPSKACMALHHGDTRSTSCQFTKSIQQAIDDADSQGSSANRAPAFQVELAVELNTKSIFLNNLLSYSFPNIPPTTELKVILEFSLDPNVDNLAKINDPPHMSPGHSPSSNCPRDAFPGYTSPSPATTTPTSDINAQNFWKPWGVQPVDNLQAYSQNTTTPSENPIARQSDEDHTPLPSATLPQWPAVCSSVDLPTDSALDPNRIFDIQNVDIDPFYSQLFSAYAGWSYTTNGDEVAYVQGLEGVQGSDYDIHTVGDGCFAYSAQYL